ncbi:alanine racemase [Nocardioides zeae]|uniref:Alanine racemase n=1 Tax=Nocardioides imazamoxiresistens TaxID=3231893 RepID=A0ABU3PT28_9ACTN|nr:alanine racemase [Nocardioides zeae]MDT9592373.1 alanine racemase [Nocardioides zeae]
MSHRDPLTPFLSVDAARVRRNVERVQAAADARGVALRPHVKTHKVPQLARLQVEAGEVGITVATLGEAETFVAAGLDDVLVAYPVLLDEAGLRRAAALAERARLVVGVDAVEGVRRAAPLAGRVAISIEVDSGHHRTGVAPGEAGAVAAAAADAGIEVAGVFTFPGHSYAPGAGPDAAAAELAALDAAADAARARGVEVPVRSGGSTPSLAASLAAPRVPDELRPGVYLFGDAQQWELGRTGPDDVALTCVASVVSTVGGRVVLDAGSKALGADRAAYATGFGRLLDHPDARIVQLSEHHAVVELGDAPLPRVGERLRVVPNHVCAAVNLADELWIDGEPVPVAARGRNA